ncbi:hypothetical protein Tcan_02565 [Toxocara canis]|uniref:7TM GPCR serpentine receptor class x (Srx) domain-containing protein n=1 Tax=Toxocara canis TaxID=6265 RepID=A0A0B2UPI7_TOXCA|nr:hypothetical protein Tcan_02565 [Toxocara canis]
MQYPAAICHFMSDPHFNEVINRICGSILNAGWTSYVALTLLLSLNRFATLVGNKWISALFTGKTLKGFVIACWVWGGIFLVAYMGPTLEIRYIPEMLTWRYSGRQPTERIVRHIAIISAILEIAVTALVYFATFVFLCFKQLCIHAPLQPANCNGPRVGTRELQILIQV